MMICVSGLYALGYDYDYLDVTREAHLWALAIRSNPHFNHGLGIHNLDERSALARGAYSLSAETERLRAEIALLRYQERLYQQTKHRSDPERLAHDRRERRLVEITAELEILHKKRRS